MPGVHRNKLFPPYVAVPMALMRSLIKQSFPGRRRKINKVSCDANMHDMTAV